MAPLIPFDAVVHYFEEFEHTAWRLETQRAYAVDRAGERWKRWQEGSAFGYEPDVPWHALVRKAAEAGKRFERVRLVDTPPTDGQRYLLATAAGNVEAGEDIHVLTRTEAVRRGLPDFDFWLFDSRTVVTFAFDADGNTLGVRVSENPETVLAACQTRDLAWHFAIPTAAFSASMQSAV
ncbi:DUF6879 family protein [Streptomyces sp. NPDC029216]|uniref:DUF6879 family protein n=1 Tax=Streptomyces sp. NPDC029216 TaxID=3154701 RepID=UPI0033E2F12F